MYQVICDNNVLYDPRVKGLEILNAKLKLEVNKVGLFDFTIYPTHPLYASINKLKSVIEVYQDGVLIFRGRVLNDTMRFDKAKEIECEGDLAFFNDSIMRPYNFSGSVSDYLQEIITSHNTQVESAKQFTLGNVTVTDPNNLIVRSNINHVKSWDEINDKLIKLLGGYIMVRRAGGVNYIDYLEDSSFMSTQVIELGQNLLDVIKETRADEIITALIPLGTRLKDVEGNDTDERLTISSVNGGVDYVYDQDAVDLYGWIFDTKTWDGVTDPNNLLTRANQELVVRINLGVSVELKAIDLSMIKETSTNLFEDEVESGDIIISNGLNAPSGTRTRWKNHIKITPNVQYTINRGSSVGDAGFRFYGINKNYLGTIEPGMLVGKLTRTFTARSDVHYIRMIVENTDLTMIWTLTSSIGETRTISDIDEIRVFEYVNVKSEPHGIDTMALITKLTIDLLNPQNNAFTFGFNYETFTDKQFQSEQAIRRIESDYVRNEAVTDVKNTLTTLSSNIEQTAEQIRTEVAENYVETGAFTQYQSQVSTQFTQTSTDFTFLFQTLEQVVQTLDGETQAQFAEFVKYIRFIDGTIELGEVNNPIKLVLQNDRISFTQSGAEVAYIANNILYITDGRFLNSLRIGNFAFTPRTNGSLSFGKVV